MEAPPATYAEWVDVIHAFEVGERDDAVIELLQSARIVLSAGMGERLYRRIIDVLELRVRRVSSSLQRRLGRSADPIAFGVAIVSARKDLGVLARFVTAPCWPADATKMMRESLDDFARKTQQALEESARKQERFDRGAQLSLVRRTFLSVPWPQPNLPSKSKVFGAGLEPPAGANRRIIF